MHLARAGIWRNHLSPGLWNIAGDCLFYTDNINQAREAYLQASDVSPRDIRSLLNLAWIATHVGQDDVALRYIAQGLARDHDDTFREVCWPSRPISSMRAPHCTKRTQSDR